MTFTEVTTVPANTGLLLKGNEGDCEINVVAGGEIGTIQNALQGVLVDTEMASGIYVLMNPDGGNGVGFYQTKSAFTVGAYTAYLPASAGASRTFIALDEATGIDAMLVNGEEGIVNSVYDLQGRRIESSILKKGLYIMNGKKVLVK